MAKTAPFDAYDERYEHWFDEHQAAYLSELLALRSLVPWEGHGLEIGVGTGRFAAPLGVPVGVDPSGAMLCRAAARGIETVRGVAEALPVPDAPGSKLSWLRSNAARRRHTQGFSSSPYS